MAIKVLCVIPSRIGSTRLTRKPLSQIGDRTMVEWVCAAANACSEIDKTIVATDSEKIVKIIEKAGGHAEITNHNISTGSDRVAAISARYSEYDVVINLQGDEPFIKPEMLSTLIIPFKNKDKPNMATLCSPLNFEKSYESPDTVKVILNQKAQALYFSRSPIPYQREVITNIPVYHHIGIYAYDRDFLALYTKLTQTPLELSEKLEQLRAMEHGYSIHVEVVNKKTLEINTKAELEAARRKVTEERLTACE